MIRIITQVADPKAVAPAIALHLLSHWRF